jgi:hypothetical protein
LNIEPNFELFMSEAPCQTPYVPLLSGSIAPLAVKKLARRQKLYRFSIVGGLFAGSSR